MELNMMHDQKIEILGAEYHIHFVDKFPEHLNEFQDTADALCSPSNREIYVITKRKKDITSEGMERAIKRSLRHEIIHAYLYESGLSSNTYGYVGAWAEHEEMVDWFAIQAPKIYQTFQEVGCI